MCVTATAKRRRKQAKLENRARKFRQRKLIADAKARRK